MRPSIPPICAVLLISIIACGFYTASRIVPYQVDDAHITYRYAVNLINGYPFQFNHFGPAVEGFTSPFWLLSLAGLASIFGPEPIKFFGTFLGLLSYCLIFIIIWKIFSNPNRSVNFPRQFKNCWAMVSACGLLLLFPGIIHYSVTGLETLLFTGVVLAYSGAVAGVLPLSWGIVAGLAAIWVRPEGGWLPIMLFCQLLSEGRWKELVAKRSMFMISAVIVSGITLLSFRSIIFHEFLPNTYYAKPSTFIAGLVYVINNFSTPHGFLLLILGLTGAILGNRLHRGFFGAALSWCIAVILEGGDWMIESRMMLPVFATLSLASTGAIVPISKGFDLRHPPRKSNVYLLVFVVVFAATIIYDLKADFHLIKQTKLYLASKNRETLFMADWIKSSGAKSVGLIDIGEIGFLTEAEIFDFGGLTDRRIGKAPGGHLAKRFDRDYLFDERPPEVMIFRTNYLPRIKNGQPVYSSTDMMAIVEQHIMEDKRFKEMYELEFAIHPGYVRKPNHYALLLFKKHNFNPKDEVSGLFPENYGETSKIIFSKAPQL